MADHNLPNIRTLLTEGFSAEELRRFCFDNLDFRPVYDSLAQDTGKDKIIDRLLEKADGYEKIELLLSWAKEKNPDKYEKHQPYHRVTPGPSPSGGVRETPKGAGDGQTNRKSLLLLLVISVIILVGLAYFFRNIPFQCVFPMHNPESVPIIQNFLVHNAAGNEEKYVPGDLLQLPEGTSVLVEAEVSNQSGLTCVWTATRGTLLPVGGGCATQYSPPVSGNRDTLAVRIQSPCKEYQAFAGLHIEIVR